jgi:hypothetical protein
MAVDNTSPAINAGRVSGHYGSWLSCKDHTNTELLKITTNATGSNISIGAGAGTGIVGGSGTGNIVLGHGAMPNVSDGGNNIAIGYQAMRVAVSTSSYSTAIGYQALYSHTYCGSNTAIGAFTMTGYSNPSGLRNTAVGSQALMYITGANSNDNTAIGFAAMASAYGGSPGVSGTSNTAVGKDVLYSITSGNYNAVVGESALYNATSASSNSVIGRGAGEALTSGSNNTLLGREAGATLTTGGYNILIGRGAAVPSATSDGQLSIGNLIYGTGIGATGKVGIGIDAPAVTLDVNGTIRSFDLASSANPTAVVATVDGDLILQPSDASLKQSVETMTDGLAIVAALRPVRFDWKPEARMGDHRQFGFIADEVEEVAPEVIGRTRAGTRTLDYAKLTAALVGAVQSQQERIDSLEARLAALGGA